MARDLERLELRLEDSVQTQDPFLTEVASHLIRAGGKHEGLRPGFVIASAAISQNQPSPAADDVLTGGVAVELVHLGSLYHDDVMDEAQVRRNVASVNAKWGNLRAILAGDFLLARASELAASLGTEVAGLLAATIGRLCEGQVRELQDTGNPDRTEGSYTDSIEGKTASLLATSCRIGGLVAGLDRPTVDTLTEFGRYYGLAFQVVDDILDIVATDEHLGEAVGQRPARGHLHPAGDPGAQERVRPAASQSAGCHGVGLHRPLGPPTGADQRRRGGSPRRGQ